MHMSEPSNRYDEPDPQREADAIREERWAAFVDDLKYALLRHGLDTILEIVTRARRREASNDGYSGLNYTPTEHGIVQFVEAEGWGGFFSALARTLREIERARAELVDRR